MGHVSRRLTAIRYASRRLLLFTIVVCLDGRAAKPGEHGSQRPQGRVAGSFCMQLVQRRLRTVMENRCMSMDRRRVPKSKHWSLMVLDVLQDDLWHQYVRADWSAYVRCGLAVGSIDRCRAEGARFAESEACSYLSLINTKYCQFNEGT